VIQHYSGRGAVRRFPKIVGKRRNGEMDDFEHDAALQE
jgi:hypothetical protein